MSLAPQQISSQLRMMPDAELQKYAAMHQNDPYIFPLAFQESQDRKAMRSEQMAKMAGQAQPPVVQQDLAQMAPPQQPSMPNGIPLQGAGSVAQAPAPQQQATRLPEEQGIGALPAKNLQGMKDGGITGYAEKGAVTSDSPDYRQMIIEQAKAKGVDPNVALAIAGVEGTAKNPKSSAKNYFQLLDDTFKRYKGDPDKRNDPAENIRVGTDMLADNTGKLNKSLGRNPMPHELYLTHFLGEPVGTNMLRADAHQKVTDFLNDAVGPKKAASIVKSNPEVLGGDKTVGDVRNWSLQKMASSLPNLIPSAQAATLPRQAGDSASSMAIPGQSSNIKAPAAQPEQGGFENYLLNKGYQLFGTPGQEFARNAYNLLNASAGATGATYIPSYLPKAGLGIAGLGERIYNKFAPQEAGTLSQKAISELQAANKAANEQSGIASLAQNAKNLAQESGALPEEAEALSQSAAAAEKARLAQAPSKALELQNAADVRQATEAARMLEAANAARATVAGTAGLANLSSAASQPSATPTGSNTAAQTQDMEDMEDPGFGALQKLQGTPTAPSTGDIANTVTQTAGGKGGRDWNDFLLNLGLGMMAGKSPYAFQNLGEAGIGALKQEQEAKMQGLKERQVAAEELKAQTEANQSKVFGERYGISPEIQLINAMKDPEFAKRYQQLVTNKAGPMTQKDLIDNYMKTTKGQMGDFSGFQDFVQQMSPFMGTMPTGVKVTRRGD